MNRLSNIAKDRGHRTGPKRELPDELQLRKFAVRTASEVRGIFEAKGYRCLPVDAFVAKFVDKLDQLFHAVYVRRAEHPDATNRAVTNSWVERRFYLVGSVVEVPSAADAVARYGRFDAEAHVLKVWSANVYARPRKAGGAGGRADEVRGLFAGIARLPSGVAAGAASDGDSLSVAHVAELTVRLRQRFGRYPWLVLRPRRGEIALTKDRVEATRQVCLNAFDWRPVLIAFNRAVPWRCSVRRDASLRRTVVALTDGERWAAGFASPAGAKPPPGVPPKVPHRRPRVSVQATAGR